MYYIDHDTETLHINEGVIILYSYSVPCKVEQTRTPVKHSYSDDFNRQSDYYLVALEKSNSEVHVCDFVWTTPAFWKNFDRVLLNRRIFFAIVGKKPITHVEVDIFNTDISKGLLPLKGLNDLMWKDLTHLFDEIRPGSKIVVDFTTRGMIHLTVTQGVSKTRMYVLWNGGF